MSLLTSQVIVGLINVGLIAIVARVIGIKGFGQYAFAISVGAIVAVVVDFGVAFLIPREVARQRSRFEEYLVAGFVIKVIFSAGAFLVLPIFLGYFYPPDVRYAIYWAICVMILLGFVEFCVSFFNAHEQMHYSAMLRLIARLCIFVASIIAIIAGIRSVWVILAVQSCAMLCVTIIAFLFLFKLLQPSKRKFDKRICVIILKKTVPFGLFAIGGVLYLNIDNVLLSAFRDVEEIRFYQAAMRLIIIMELLPLVFSNAIYPSMSRILKNSKQNAVVLLEESLYWALVIGLPIGAIITMMAAPIVSFIFGDNYSAVVPALKIVAWLVPMRFCAHILGTTLSASGNQKFRMLATWLAAVFNIIVNLIMIPLYGYVGAAITSLFTNLFFVSFYYAIVYSRFHHFKLFSIIIRLLLPIAILLVFLRLVDQLNIFIAVGSGFLLYCIMLIPVGILTKSRILNISRLVLQKSK